MIYADDIIHIKTCLKPLHPPFVSRLLMVIPVVERIAPELAVSSEGIGRASRNRCGISLFIQLKKLRLGPGVRTVGSDIDGDISDDHYPVFVGVFLERLPLLVEFKLLESVEIRLILKKLRIPLHSLLLAKSDIIIPEQVTLSLVMVLDRHV